MTPTPAWYRSPHHRQRHLAVGVARRKLGLDPGGEDEEFQSTMRGFLKGVGFDAAQLRPYGPILNQVTAALLGEREGQGEGTPLWWEGPGTFEKYADHLRDHGITGEPALRRFQSERGIPPTGEVCESTASDLAVFE